jgi:GMP synthase PP-ATPase subunit
VEPEVVWRVIGNTIVIQIVDPNTKKTIHQEFRSLEELNLDLADVIKSVVIEERPYTTKGMMTKVGIAVNRMKKEITGKMDVWAIEAMMRSGVYPLSYELSSLSWDYVYDFLRSRVVGGVKIDRVSYSVVVSSYSVMVSDFGETFTVLYPYDVVVVFSKDASKLTVISRRAFESAEAVLSYVSRYGMKLDEEIESALSYYAVMYGTVRGYDG